MALGATGVQDGRDFGVEPEDGGDGTVGRRLPRPENSEAQTGDEGGKYELFHG
jgi:hypothetical protein